MAYPGTYIGPAFEWGQSFAGGKPQNYEQWADYDTQRLGGYSKPDLINGEQYQNFLARQNNHVSRMGGGLAAAGKAAAAMADPWASQRDQYQTSLRQLMQSPGSSMQNDPFFKWQQQQGEQAVNRAAAAQGQLRSGNRMTALSDYAQKQSGQHYFQLADLLSGLAGAKNQNPAAAASAMYQGARDEAQMPLQWYQADIGMTGATTPRTLADLAKKGYQDAMREQQMVDFNSRLSAF